MLIYKKREHENFHNEGEHNEKANCAFDLIVGLKYINRFLFSKIHSLPIFWLYNLDQSILNQSIL